MMKNPGDSCPPKTRPSQHEKAPKSLSASSVTQMHGFGLCQGNSVMPPGPDNISPLLPTASTPQTAVLLASTQLVGTMGSSHKEEGPPPNPIIMMIAAFRAALDHKGVSLHRLQARGHIPDWKERRDRCRMRTTFHLKRSSRPLG